MILVWDKPKKVMTSEEREERYSSDCGVPGTYVPNMSQEDRLKYKAKLIRGKDPRVEIRKTFGSTQTLTVVRPNAVTYSANGRVDWSDLEYKEWCRAIEEASLCFKTIVKS